jgi:hypothetical protein
MNLLKEKALGIALTGMMLVLSGCGESKGEKQAKEQALDNVTSAVVSCSIDGVKDVGIATVSLSDTVSICEKMAGRIGHNLSVKALRSLSKTMGVMSIQGYSADLSECAYQFMRIVESRRQLNDDSAMASTFNVVFKIYTGTEKRVSPKDLNMLLSSMGSSAASLSDDGLYRLGAMLSVKKQDMGG